MKKILIVDDVVVNKKILKKHLKEQYELVEATNGQEALAYLKDPATPNPDMILLDIVMPVMDGYTFLEHFKKDESISNIPVIVTTQKSDETSELNALSAGAIEFISMPYNMAMIKQRIKNIISLREQSEVIKVAERNAVTGLFQGVFFQKKISEMRSLYFNQKYDILCCQICNYPALEMSYGNNVTEGVQKLLVKKLVSITGHEEIIGHFTPSVFICLFKRKNNYKELLYPLVADTYTVNGSNIMPKIKFGVYRLMDNKQPLIDAIRYAYSAVYNIIDHYGEFISLYDEGLRVRAEGELFIENNMQKALDEKQISVHFIPQFDVFEHKLVGLTPTPKWIHKEKGEISPELFYKVFERNGFLTHLNEYIFYSVCDMLADLQKKSLRLAPVSITLSKADVFKTDITKKIVDGLKSHHLPLSAIKIIINENQIDVNDTDLMTHISTLKNKGFLFEIDNFGNSASSLNLLQKLPVDYIKINIKDSLNSNYLSGDQTFLGFIKKITHLLDIKIVAKNVDTKTDFAKMQKQNIDLMQGKFLRNTMDYYQLIDFLILQKNKQLSKEYIPSDAILSSLLHKEENNVDKVLCIGNTKESGKTIFNDDKKYMLLKVSSTNLSNKLNYYMDKVKIILINEKDSIEKTLDLLKTVRKNRKYDGTPLVVKLKDTEINNDCFILNGADDVFFEPMSEQILVHHLLKVQTYKDAITAKTEADKLKSDAYIDYLTGLLNRRGFENALNTYSKENPNACFALYMIDVDNLKTCNDTYGHPAGDELLTSFAYFLKNSVRTGDIVARLGGDEFVAVLFLSSEEIALKKASNLNKNPNWKLSFTPALPSCSVGVCMVKGAYTLQDVLGNADSALYHAKQDGKGNSKLYKGEQKND